MVTRVEIDCSDGDTWEALLEAAILKGWEAELTNFDYRMHGELCSRLVQRRKMQLFVKPENNSALVRHNGLKPAV